MPLGRARAARYLVSFNGKSFDLSVLQNRMVMHRMCSKEESELKLRPHLDLLHVSRSVYKGLWQDVRLQTLEAQVLGFVREHDMPGSLAPSCWFAWLRDAEPRPLAGIARTTGTTCCRWWRWRPCWPTRPSRARRGSA